MATLPSSHCIGDPTRADLALRNEAIAVERGEADPATASHAARPTPEPTAAPQP